MRRLLIWQAYLALYSRQYCLLLYSNSNNLEQNQGAAHTGRLKYDGLHHKPTSIKYDMSFSVLCVNVASVLHAMIFEIKMPILAMLYQ